MCVHSKLKIARQVAFPSMQAEMFRHLHSLGKHTDTIFFLSHLNRYLHRHNWSGIIGDDGQILEIVYARKTGRKY